MGLVSLKNSLLPISVLHRGIIEVSSVQSEKGLSSEPTRAGPLVWNFTLLKCRFYKLKNYTYGSHYVSFVL